MEDITAPLLRFWMSSHHVTVCRLCLTETSEWSSLHRSLYIRTEGFRGTITIKDLLILLFQTKNYEDKSFPQYICDTCLETVLRFFTFWQLCRNTEMQLTKQVKVLSKRVSVLHSHIVKNKKSKYKDETTAILYMNSKKIDYINPDGNSDDIQKYLNRNVPKNEITKCSNKAEIILTIKDNVKPKVKTFSNSSSKYHCDYCTESFAQKDYLVGHLKHHHNIFDVAECNVCGKKCKTIKLLKEHSRTHKEANFKCSICDNDFQTTANLEDHMNDAHTELKYKCRECHKIFKRERDLSIHQWNAHNAGYEYYCKVCGKKFKNYYSVKAHEEAHEGYDCDKCAQKFNSKIKLKQHFMLCFEISTDAIMSEFETYTCHFCQKTFFRKATLRQHILNLHLFPKRFKCPKCAKRVNTKTQLDAHMVVHTRERTEQCKICYNYFVTKYALTYHMRLHTGERPYPCSKCDEKFLSASRRMAHMKRKHIGRTEQCTICTSSFYSGYALKRHMQRHFDPNSTLFENNGG